MGYLQVKFGEQLGNASYVPGQPGGAGGPSGPPAPNVGAGWEVKVLGAPSYNQLLAVIPPKVFLGLQFVKQLKDTGSGTVTLNMDDPFWQGENAIAGYRAAIGADTPQAWWQLNDAAGASVATDSTANLRNGTPTAVTFGNTTCSVPGLTSAAFNGSTSKITTTYNPSGAAFSVEAWVNLNNLTQGSSPDIIANSVTSSANTGFVLQITGSQAQFYVGNGTTNANVLTSTGAIPATGWVYLVGTYDGTTVRLYVNGVQSGTGSALAGSMAAGATNIGIGFNPSANTDFFAGLIDQVAVYTSTLSQARITAHYQAISTRFVLPNGQPAHYLLDYEHVWQVFQDGVPRFEFLGETVTEQLDDQSEQRVVTVTGPGAIAALKWAMAAPPGFPGTITYKLDALQDSFNAVDQNGNLVIDYGLWNASANTNRISVNPSGNAQLMGSPSGTILGSTVYDATNTLISAQISPILSPDINGNVTNGSQLTQMYVQSTQNTNYYALMGLSGTVFYAQLTGPSGTFTKTIASLAQFTAAGQGSNNYAYWQISETSTGGTSGTFNFWTSSDGQNWHKVWSVVHNWDATQCGLYFMSQYSVDNTYSAAVTSINSNITTSSLGGPLYFNQSIIGGVWLDLLNKAKARGTIPFITTGQLSAGTDSFNNAWNDSQSVQIQNGTDLLTLLGAHASMINADWIMQPGFRLQVGIPEPSSITLGFDRSNSVIFRDGQDAVTRVRSRARNEILNLLAVINQDGRTITASDTSSEALWSQREGWLQAAMQVSQQDLTIVATAADLENSFETLSQTLTVTPYIPGRTVFTGFDVGDWVGLERPDFSAIDKVRVVAIAVAVDQTGAETHELTLNTYVQWLTQQLQFIATKMGGGFVGATGTTAIPNNAQLTNLNAPTIANPTLPGLSGVLAGGPGSNKPLVYDPNTGQWVPAGTINPDSGDVTDVVISGTGGQTTISGTGSGVTVTNVPQPPADGGGAPPTPQGQVIGITNTTIVDATGTTRQIIGIQPDGTFTSTDHGGAAPGVPDTPTVTGTLNGVLVTWDGLIGASAPLADFLWCEVHVSTTTGFTPSSATLKGTLVSAAVFPVTGLTVGTTYFVKLMARNTSGVAGTPSVQASAVPTALTASLVGQLGVLNANPYFAGGDGSGWAALSAGTFAVSSSPPSGTPFPYAGLYTAAAGAGAAAESGQPFRVAASTQYLVTAWVYSPQTSCIIGFDWLNASFSVLSTSTQTFTITANTWTLVTTVQTSNASAVWAYPRIAPLAGAGNTIYMEGVLCLPQVPGSLVQAGTITATQIAANTITAAQIASNTITATQIAANTITAGQIAANTITASQIASGTITAGLLAAGIVKAGIIDGTSVSAQTYLCTGSTGQFLAYSGTPAAGNLINAIAGAAGSDSFGNDWPKGLFSQQLTLEDQSSAPPTFSGASVLYTSSSGRLRYISSAGNDLVLDRSVLDLTNFTMGTQTLPVIMSSTLNYLANEAQSGSEYEIEIDGTITTPSSTTTSLPVYNWSFFIDGVGTGINNVTVGAVMLSSNLTVAYCIRARLTVNATGAGGSCDIVFDGGVSIQFNGASQFNLGNSSPVHTGGGGGQGSTPVNQLTVGKAFDTTSNHSLAIYGNWGTSSGTSLNQSGITYRTKKTRRN